MKDSIKDKDGNHLFSNRQEDVGELMDILIERIEYGLIH